ncbi:MAG: aspartate kinase [Coriobacteriales bacterium]|jgi:aspartate kinase|nr:aspartate kinase [Coriobacteriales bacterium]
MSLIVAKFGGTSLATPERVKDVAARLVEYHNQKHRVVAVVSAMGKSTDDLLKLALSINKRPPSRELDRLLATGEQASMAVLAMAIDALGVCSVSLSGRQAGIVTTSVFSKAQISEIHADRINEELDSGRIVVVAGFQGITPKGDITTLGRGGSDTTAVALAAGLKADICEIYSDVDGIYTADPRQVPRASKLKSITYEDMLELCASGSGVLQMRSVEVARNFNVVLHCRSAFSSDEGTYVREDQKSGEGESVEESIVTGIVADLSKVKVTLRGVPDRIGLAAELFTTIAEGGVMVDMIVQNISEFGTTDISFTVPESELPRLRPILDGAIEQLGAREYIIKEEMVKLSVVGAGMQSSPGIAAQMFRVLAEAGVNIDMIATSSIRISVVVGYDKVERVMQALHTAYGLDSSEDFTDTHLSAEELAAKLSKGR